MTNSEAVAHLLKHRGADSDAPSSKARPSERIALRYLEANCAGRLTREQLEGFRAALEPFQLTRLEVMQVLNMAPHSHVEAHLIVRDAEERLGGEEGIERLLAVVAQHSPVAAARRLRAAGAGGGGDG